MSVKKSDNDSFESLLSVYCSDSEGEERSNDNDKESNAFQIAQPKWKRQRTHWEENTNAPNTGEVKSGSSPAASFSEFTDKHFAERDRERSDSKMRDYQRKEVNRRIGETSHKVKKAIDRLNPGMGYIVVKQNKEKEFSMEGKIFVTYTTDKAGEIELKECDCE